MTGRTEVTVLDTGADCPELPIVEGSGVARAVVWPGTGAHLRSMHTIDLDIGARTIRLEHPMEAVYYVIQGRGVVRDPDTDESFDLEAGSMVHIDPGTPYRFETADGGVRIVGGPCPPDPSVYRDLPRAEGSGFRDRTEGG